MVDGAVTDGVDAPQLTLLRDGALLQAHAALLRRLAYVFPAKSFVTHEVPARITLKTWQRVGERTPFVAVGFSHVEPDRGAPRLYGGRAVWTVFLGARQPRSDAMLTGDGRLPGGLLGLAQVAVAALHSQTDPGVGTWLCGPIQNLYDDNWAADDLGVIGVEASMQLQITDPAAAAALPSFLRLGGSLEWDLPAAPPPMDDHLPTLMIGAA